LLGLLVQCTFSATLSTIQVVNNFRGLNGAYDVKASPDGRFLYVPSDNDNSTVVLARDQSTGMLSFVQQFVHTYHALNCYMSPDGSFLYTAGAVYERENPGPFPGHITVFSRSAATGMLTPIQSLNSGLTGYGLIMSGSPDGEALYLGMGTAIAVMTRNDMTGYLTLVNVVSVPNSGAYAVDATSNNVYAVGNSIVSCFSRSWPSGSLNMIQQLPNYQPQADWVSLSSDRTIIYTGSYYNSGGVTIFSRAHNGTATVLQVVDRNMVAFMSNIAVVMPSSSGKYLFVGGSSLYILKITADGRVQTSEVPSSNVGKGGIGIVQIGNNIYYVCDATSSIVVYNWIE